MTIRYSLHPNNLKNKKKDFFAKVQLTGSVDLEDIINRMDELGSTVTKADSMAVIEDCTRAVESFLLEGYRVNIGGLVQIYPGIKGSFNNYEDSFKKGKHRLHASARPGARISKKLQLKGKAIKVDSSTPWPALSEFRDIFTDTRNTILTPGSIGMIWGEDLKFNPEETDEGIFFVNINDKTRIRISQVQKNQPKELVFLIPQDLEKGAEYSLIVRRRAKNSSSLRTGTLSKTLRPA